VGLRNQECSGLHWDCVDFDGRMIYVRRIWRSGKGIIPTTKTGKKGYRGIPMSPILFAALDTYAERMESLGYKLEGPVLRTRQAPIITPDAISAAHWTTVASKAGFMDQDGGLKHQFYALRHTAANLWRAIGIQPDRLQKLMGHYRYDTTADNYLHETPEYGVLARDWSATSSRTRREHSPAA
jgi:integrase